MSWPTTADPSQGNVALSLPTTLRQGMEISIPCLNVVGRLSATFPWEGSAVVGQLIPNCHTVRPFLISASPLKMLLSSRICLLVHATLQRIALQQKKETQLALTLSE